MRLLVASTVVIGVVAAAAGSAIAANQVPKLSAALRATTGTVRALDLSQITVGRVTCSFASTKMEALTENFDLGENVAIGCQRGVLRTIKLAAITVPAHQVPYLRTTVAPVTPSAPTGPGGFKVIFTSGEQTDGPAPTGGATSSSASATGPITAITTVTLIGTISGTSITVGDATCTVLGAPPFLQFLQVGTVASISCTGTAANGLSLSGTISSQAS